MKHARTSHVLSWFAVVASVSLVASAAHARVGSHENRLRGSDYIVQHEFHEVAAVQERRRRVITFEKAAVGGTTLRVRAAINRGGYVTEVSLVGPSAFFDRLRVERLADISDFLVFLLPPAEEDEIYPIAYDDLSALRQHASGTRSPLVRALIGEIPSASARFSSADVRVTSSENERSITISFRGRPVRDPDAEQRTARPPTRTDGSPLRPRPTQQDAVALITASRAAVSSCDFGPNPPSMLAIEVRLRWDGSVSQATLAGSPPAPYAQCVESAVMHLRSEPFLQYEYTFSFPMRVR